MRCGRAAGALLVGLAACVVLGGCSIVMAIRQPERKDLSALAPGSPRALVIAKLGGPEYTELIEGRRIDYFNFIQGYSQRVKYSRAAFHTVADVFSLGLWEIVGTPTEAIFDGTPVAFRVTYSEGLGVDEVVVFKGGKVVKEVPGARYASVEDEEALTSAPGIFAAVDSQEFSPGYEHQIAAVIGINDYEKLAPLEGARADAEHVAERLRKRGFEVIELYDGDATRDRILDLIGQELQEKADTESLVVIFFAGHGQTETLPNGGKRGYISPVDTDPDHVFATAISMATLRELSNRLAAKHVYYAMDSCYSGLGLTRGAGLSSQGEGYLDQMTSRRAVQMITAGREDELAIEVNGRGIFTDSFLRAIDGEADANGDGWVTASEVGAFVPEQVASITNAKQTPMYGTLEGRGEVVFRVGGSAGRLIVDR